MKKETEIIKNCKIILAKSIYSETCLILDENLLFDEWQQIIKQLRYIEGAVQWWLGDALQFGDRKYGEKYSQALDDNSSVQTWMNCKWVAGRFCASRRRDALSFSHHSEVASLEPEEADQLLLQAEEKQLTRQELRTIVRLIRHQNLLANSISPNGKYQIVYADPPWRYEHPISISREIENQYPTMELEEICALTIDKRPVRELAEKDGIIFLWCPPALTKNAILVLEEWGFDYRTNAVWVKPSIGPGQWVRQRHELLLIGARGDMPTPMGENKPNSVIEAPREGHSKKPDIFYDLIDKMYPNFKKIELFARQNTNRKGWTFWGNQC